MAIEPGRQLLHYRLIEKIGEGGMGVVWKALDTRLHRHVALKFVPRERARDPQYVDRHLREARAASALNHPNICSIHDIGEWEGRRFLVMELLEGRSLEHRIGGKPIGVDTAVDLAIQIADALEAAHSRGIVHRDIKSANIFLDDGGRAKILDFGLAKLAAGAANFDDDTRTDLEMTAPGSVMGTVSYMSPEQALGKELDHRTDIFSLGVVLYEMITGRRAFDGSTPAAVFDAILNRAPTAPVVLNREVPPELERIVNKALEKEPELRYQSAAGLSADLKRLRRDSESGAVAAATEPAAPGGGRAGLYLAGAAVLIAGIVLAAIALNSREGHGEANGAKRHGKGPSIAVLPFADAGGDPEQKYFSDGLAADIITELARYRELSVVAHSSASLYGGGEIDVRQVGAALGVRYLLHGGVRRDGQQIRVNVRLSDTSTGLSVWGDRYERDLTARDLFDLQDELTQRVVNEIAGSYGALTRVGLPGARRKPPENLDSYDCVLRTYEYIYVHTPENHLAARECLEGVIESDLDYVEGRAWLAYLYADQYHHRWNEQPDRYDSLDRALEFAERAVELDTVNHVAHGALALTCFLRGEAERGRLEAYRAVELNPNDALWLALLGQYLVVRAGDFEGGLRMVRKAIDLNPHPPGWHANALFLDHYFHGRYEEALADAIRVETADFRRALFLAATYARLGRAVEAGRALDDFLEQWGRPVSDIREEMHHRQAFFPELAEQLIEGLVMAGLDPAAAPAEPDR